MPIQSSSSEDTDSQQSSDHAHWYQHPIYSNYWNHYNYMHEWMRKHQIATMKATIEALQYENSALRQLVGSINPSYSVSNYWNFSAGPTCSSGESRRVVETTVRSKKKRKRRSKSGNAKGDESDEGEFEVSEEMMAFFEHSVRHREELRLKRENEDMQDKVEDMKMHLPPTEQPGTKKAREMKALYGNQVAVISGMETAIQLSFDRFCDRFSPTLWPNIPLKL